MQKIKPDPRFAHIDVRINCEVGFGSYTDTRRAVEEVNFAGGNIKYLEGPGALSRVFSFHGNAESIYYLRGKLDPGFSGSDACRDYFRKLLSAEHRAAAAKPAAAKAPAVSDSGRAFAAGVDKIAAMMAKSVIPRT